MKKLHLLTFLFLTSCSSKTFDGEIIDKVYTPSSSSTGVGVTSTGKTAIIVTYHDEKFTLLLRLPNGDVIPVETSARDFAKEKGTHVSVNSSWIGYTLVK